MSSDIKNKEFLLTIAFVVFAILGVSVIIGGLFIFLAGFSNMMNDFLSGLNSVNDSLIIFASIGLTSLGVLSLILGFAVIRTSRNVRVKPTKFTEYLIVVILFTTLGWSIILWTAHEAGI